MDTGMKVLLLVVLVVLALAALPADVGCEVGPQATTAAKLWASTCEVGP